MTLFPAQWHHLAVEDSFNSLSYPPCFPPACFSHHPLRASSPVISLASQTSSNSTHSVVLRPSCAFSLSPSLLLSSTFFPTLPLHAYPSVFLSLPRFALFHPISLFVADSSAPQEHWGEQRKQRFGSVALILIFCRLDGRLGGAFIHTPHNHFPLQLQTMTADHRGCSYQHKCAICDKASLCFLPKTMTIRGTQCTERRSLRSWCEMQDGKESETKAQCSTYEPKLSHHNRKEEMNQS